MRRGRPQFLPSPATSSMQENSHLEVPPSGIHPHRLYTYPLVIVVDGATVAASLSCASLTYIYKNLVLFTLPPIYQGYLGNHHHRTSRLGGRFEYDSKAWNRVVSWTASVCYATIVCTLCCLQNTLPVAYNNSTMAVAFGYITASISIGGLLSAIIIAVFMRLAEAHNRKVTILTAGIDDQEREWRVQHIALVLSVPPSSLIWSLIFIVAAMIFFPGEAQMHTIHLSAHKNLREGHLVDVRSANPSLTDAPTNDQPSSLPPAALMLVLTVAALVILHLFFILRTITRLINTKSDSTYKADNRDSSQRVRPDAGTLGRAQASCSDRDSSSRSTSESECGQGSGDSTESDIGLQLNLPGSLVRRRRRALKSPNTRSIRRKGVVPIFCAT